MKKPEHLRTLIRHCNLPVLKNSTSAWCVTILLLMICLGSTAQTTYNFSTPATLSNLGGFYTMQALVTIDGVSYKLTHLGNGNFSNLSNGGSGNSACLKKDGSGGDFLKIERADGAAFQFYGMWLSSASMYSPPYYQPPYYDIKYYDPNNTEITAETYISNTQNETITVTKNLKVNYVYVTYNAILTFKLDDLIVGPAAASAPTVTTSSINQFSNSTALVAGNVTNDGGAAVTERGIVYNTAGTPTISDNKIAIGSGTGSFSQTITGLSSNTMYYIRSYATNSAGTSYGSQVSFSTAADFVLPQVHYFNSSWASTSSQPTPFTKYVEGWNITGTSTGSGLVSVSRITAATGAAAVAEGAASARISSGTSTEALASVSIKANDNSAFNLKSFKFKYLTKTAGTYFNTITLTGYRNGTAVPGAVASLTGIAQATSTSYAYSTFDVSTNNAFGGIDQFVITASNSPNAAKWSAIDLDVLDVQSFNTLPVLLGSFTGRQTGNAVILKWLTAQELETSIFEIERSANGAGYTRIGEVKAAGESQSNKNYTFTDNGAFAGNNYYRLKMVNQNGSFTYSNIVSIKMTGSDPGFTVYPNPLNDDKCFISVAGGTKLPLSYRIVNTDGKSVQKGTLTSAKQQLSMAGLAKGNYVILLGNGESKKIVF